MSETLQDEAAKLVAWLHDEQAAMMGAAGADYSEEPLVIYGQCENALRDMSDALAALEAERDRLQGELAGMLRAAHDNHDALCRAEKAEAERDRLREAADLYVVWSNQHRLWRPECRGYTSDVREAGLYTRADAMSISHKCRDGWMPGERPDEIPVRVSDLPEWAIASLKETAT